MDETPVTDGPDSLRTYVITLRKLAKLDQDEVAAQIGIGYRTYMAWEQGETRGLKLPIARRLLQVIGGSFQHLASIDALTADEAQDLAAQWHRLSPEERAAAQADPHGRRAVALGDDDPPTLDALLRRLRDMAREDAALIDLISGYLDGYLAAVRMRGR
ncbi:MAG: helix-turn-helix transcriptional regulator [Kouleothrix sp.]|nr:helix-turn-helix transcriptional regulator [Kouleothrix sp.]